MTVPKEQWTRCLPWLESAVTRCGFYEMADIERMVEAGELVFWPGEHAAVLTEFISYPKGKVLNVFAGGGDTQEALDELLDRFEPELAQWAAANGCRWILGYGRPGWERTKLKQGYTRLWSVMRKELSTDGWKHENPTAEHQQQYN